MAQVSEAITKLPLDEILMKYASIKYDYSFGVAMLFAGSQKHCHL